MKDVSQEQAIYFRNEFRKARLATERDPQNCLAIAQVLESFGTQVCSNKHEHSIGRCAGAVKKFVRKFNPISETLCPDYHIRFGRLYEIVRDSRNDLAHRGSRAKYFAPRFMELTIAIEDALMNHDKIEKVQDYMVRDVATAQLSQPLSAIRQAMLINSFSYMPYFDKDDKGKCNWFVVSDADIADYLRSGSSERDKRDRLNHTLKCATTDENGMARCKPTVYEPEKLVSEIFEDCEWRKKRHLPILVCRADDKQHLLGILTASDLM